MASKKAPAQRVANLNLRFVRIKAAIMVVDTLLTNHLDRVADDLEGFAADVEAMTAPHVEEKPSAN